MSAKDRFLRKPEMIKRTGVSDTTLWRWEKAGLFPKRIQLGPNVSGWLESEFDAWKAARVQARDEATA